MKTNLSKAPSPAPRGQLVAPTAAGNLSPDIVVVGGGMAGVMSALSAKTPDNRVLIVEPSNVLGGQGTAGGVAGFCGDTRNVNDDFQDLVARLQRYGFIREFNPTDDRRSYDLEWCAYFLQEMVQERGIDVLLHSRMTGAEAKDGLVTAVDVSTVGGLCRLTPKFVIDATGACLVPAMAGFPVIHEGANRQLPMSLYFTLWDSRKPVRPFLPPSCAAWKSDDEIPMTTLHSFESGKVEVKMKVVGFDAADGLSFSRAEMHARRQMISLIYYLQTKGYRGMKLDRHVLSSVSRHIGVRETRRIEGEHLLTVEEIMHGTVFPDAVAVGTYHLDYHWPDQMQRNDTGVTTMVEPYHIPLRAMIPKGARNLLVPGRGASGDQMAMSSFRVMAPVSQMGFAAGKAAQLCVRDGCLLDDLKLPQLQEAIEAGGQHLDLSKFGEYLRNGLLDHETVVAADSLPGPATAPALVQLRNNRFLVAWTVVSESGSDVWVADRYQCRWSPPRRVASVTGPVSALLVQREGQRGVRLDWWTRTSEGGAHSVDEGQTWGDRVSGGSTASPRPTTPPPTWLALAESMQVRVGDSPVGEVGAGSGFGVGLSLDGGATWPHFRPLEDAGIGRDPCMVATPRGVALVYVRADGVPMFWHASVEQVMDRSALEKYSEALHFGIMP
jgi:hypothetical protein